MILTRKCILDEIEKKNIAVVPFNKSCVGPASVDLSLGDHVRVFNIADSISVREFVDYKKYTKKVSIKEGFVLKPGTLVLGITKERIKLPSNICGWLQSRSRFARLGLVVHMTAPFMQPGINNHQVLEIFNAGPNDLRLKPGIRICQFIFERCEGEAKYRGKFSNQSL